MSPRGRRLVAVATLAVGALFAGRWLVGLLADRWWAGQFSPAAVLLVTDVAVLKLTLDAAGALIASAWFIGNLVLVYRAIGSIQVPRHIGNLEITEALTPRLMLGVVVAAGLLLGIVVGGGSVSGWWRLVVLAWHGVSFGVAEPLLQQDVGVFVAQVPLWDAVHDAVALLVLLGLACVFTLYVVIGAIRWMGGRPAVSDHARSHLGALLGVWALVLAWGYVLAPYVALASGGAKADPTLSHVTAALAPALAGCALTAALMSFLWAARPRHGLAIAGWIVLAVAALAGPRIAPLFATPEPASVGAAARLRIADLAFGLETVGEMRFRAREPLVVPKPFSLWHAEAIARAALSGTDSVVSVAPQLLRIGAERRPTWVAVRGAPGREAAVVVIADDRTTAAGTPLYYRAADTLAYPNPYVYVDVTSHAVRPEALAYDVAPEARGITVGDPLRRLALAWALQAGELLGGVQDSEKVAWRLTPRERLDQLAPFADWGEGVPRVIAGQLVWVVPGYVSGAYYPSVARTAWRAGEVGMLRAAFVGTIDAESGATHIYLRPDGGPVARAWADVAGELVEPWRALPAAVGDVLPYPAELFRVQALALARSGRANGTLGTRQGPPELAPARADIRWRADGADLVAAFEEPEERRLTALLTGADGPAAALTLHQLDAPSTVPEPSMLVYRWQRFPTFTQFRDSVTSTGGKLMDGPVRFAFEPTLVAYQVEVGVPAGGLPTAAWVSVASADRLGAGRNLTEAWNNLRGASVPEPAGIREDAMTEARRWMRRADSALRRGDWEGFGRAFESLRATLRASSDTARETPR